MNKPTEQCPGCNAARTGIAEGIAYFKCGSYYWIADGGLIYESAECYNTKPEGLFSQGEAQ